MAKRKHRMPSSGPVWQRSAEDATRDRMPKYNAHICRTGPHGDTKYNRAKQKRTWQQETRNGGSLLFWGGGTVRHFRSGT